MSVFSEPSLRMMNDLLDAAGYSPMWAEPDGALRSMPSERADWTGIALDMSDVEPVGPAPDDLWSPPPGWRLISREES